MVAGVSQHSWPLVDGDRAGEPLHPAAIGLNQDGLAFRLPYFLYKHMAVTGSYAAVLLEADLNATPRQWNPAVDVFGRPKPGITRAQAEAEVLSIAGNLASEHGRSESTRRASVQLQSLETPVGRSFLIVGILAAALVLLSAAGAAVFLPARRAARVNPAHLLKLG